jgi:hypothetical protein
VPEACRAFDTPLGLAKHEIRDEATTPPALPAWGCALEASTKRSTRRRSCGAEMNCAGREPPRRPGDASFMAGLRKPISGTRRVERYGQRPLRSTPEARRGLADRTWRPRFGVVSLPLRPQRRAAEREASWASPRSRARSLRGQRSSRSKRSVQGATDPPGRRCDDRGCQLQGRRNDESVDGVGRPQSGARQQGAGTSSHAIFERLDQDASALQERVDWSVERPPRDRPRPARVQAPGRERLSRGQLVRSLERGRPALPDPSLGPARLPPRHPELALGPRASGVGQFVSVHRPQIPV